jgi:retron-type reverse transcriptase
VHDTKRRTITAPPFADRIVHHALVRAVEPLFERRFIYDSYACRRGKGTHAAVRRTQHFLRIAKRNWGDTIYVVHADIASYFQSIRHDVALSCVARVVSDPDVLWLWRQVMSGYGYKEQGLPLGALTVS